MRAKDYAGAVIALSKKGESDAKIIGALVKELQLRGETKLLPGILGELKRGLMRQTILAPRVEVAHKKDEAAALRAAKAEGIDAVSCARPATASPRSTASKAQS
jgi:hypothetical protein